MKWITVLSDGQTWDVGGCLVEISEDEYNSLNAIGDLDELVSGREFKLKDIVEDDGEDLNDIMMEDLDPVLKSHRRELSNRAIANVALGNTDEALRIMRFLGK